MIMIIIILMIIIIIIIKIIITIIIIIITMALFPQRDSLMNYIEDTESEYFLINLL